MFSSSFFFAYAYNSANIAGVNSRAAFTHVESIKMKEKLKRADAWNKFCISRVCERVLNDASWFLFCFISWLQASPTQNFSVVFWVEPDKCYRGTWH